MARVIDMKGERFGRLNVISRSGKDKHGNILWSCLCDCGNSHVVSGAVLRSGGSNSCGCLQREIVKGLKTKHGKCGTSEYSSWEHMIRRCNDPRDENYHHYGGRGIRVCERWRDFGNFYSDMGNKPTESYTIERINVNGDYEPDNCRWATRSEQNRNTRIFEINASGHKGIHWHTGKRKWHARIGLNGRLLHIGYFSSIGDAIRAREAAEMKYWGVG